MSALPSKADIAERDCMFAKRPANTVRSSIAALRLHTVGSGAATDTTEAEIGRFPKELQIVCIDVCTIFNKICLGFAIQS